MDLQNYSIVVLVANGVISLFFSLLTLWLIYSMKKRNGYLLLIVQLTIAQAIYDISIVMIAGPIEVYLTYTGLRTISGLASTLWTNVISFVVLYVVWYLRVYDIQGNIYLLSSIVMIPSISIGLSIPLVISNLSALSIASYFYSYFRWASIVFNVVVYLVLTLKLKARRFKRSRLLGPEGIDPIEVLTHRMKYYPIVQVITRGGSLWYESQYGYGYSYFLSTSTEYRVSVMVYAICLPVAGIGYFLIFVLLCPGASTRLYNTFASLTCGKCPLLPEGDVRIRAFDNNYGRGTVESNPSVTKFGTCRDDLESELSRVSSSSMNFAAGGSTGTDINIGNDNYDQDPDEAFHKERVDTISIGSGVTPDSGKGALNINYYYYDEEELSIEINNIYSKYSNSPPIS